MASSDIAKKRLEALKTRLAENGGGIYLPDEELDQIFEEIKELQSGTWKPQVEKPPRSWRTRYPRLGDDIYMQDLMPPKPPVPRRLVNLGTDAPRQARGIDASDLSMPSQEVSTPNRPVHLLNESRVPFYSETRMPITGDAPNRPKPIESAQTRRAKYNQSTEQRRLSYPQKRAEREALREIANTRRSEVYAAAQKRTMPPAQLNPMSEAVDRRLTLSDGANKTTRRPLRDARVVKGNPLQPIAEKVSNDLGTRAENILRTSAPPMVQAAERPVAGSYAILEGEAPAAAAGAAERMAGRGIVRALGKVAPVIGDLILPYASITGGEMYPQSEDGIYSSAVGGPLPPQYAAANEREMQRRIPIENLAAQQAQARTQYGLEGPMQLNPVPLRTNMAATLQQPQEPQSFAHQLATSNEPVEPESFAQRLSQEPAGEFEHYVKIYGSPERARQAMAQKYQSQQPNY